MTLNYQNYIEQEADNERRRERQEAYERFVPNQESKTMETQQKANDEFARNIGLIPHKSTGPWAECETCNGTGRVTTTNKWSVDSGTKWKRSFVEQVDVECPECSD